MNLTTVLQFFKGKLWSILKSSTTLLANWQYWALGAVLGYAGILHIENNHLKQITQYAEQRAKQAEQALSLVVKTQKIVQEEEQTLEQVKRTIKNDAEKTKHTVSSVVKLDDADAHKLQEYARTINNRHNSKHSK